MKKAARLFACFLLFLLFTSALTVVFSPYGKQENFPYRSVVNSVEINAPPDTVFHYLGNSAHAHNWSVFVDHITTLNADSFPDGTPGSRRRCFRQQNENGIRWDEEVTQVEPGKKRQLTIYNMKEFPLMADGLATEQIYEPLKNGNACRLTFTVFYLHHSPTFFETFKTYIAAYRINDIFKANLGNIKRIVEEENGYKG
ncbi:MAG TPA: SRPBCC family protein [Bacteroidia bacterium]|nr:SRPBCC family protein [Bacteroidia bacterium]